MASIVAAIDVMEEEKIVDNAAAMGELHLRPGLEKLAAKHPIVGDVRGLGCFFALDLVSDPVAKTPVTPAVMADIKASLIANRLLPFIVDNRIHVVPPLIVNPGEIDQALSLYDEAFTQLAS
jgi:taurine---2-oxoglutarate transaminase